MHSPYHFASFAVCGYAPPLMESYSDGKGPIISVDNVRVEFGRLIAVKNVSFALRGGDLLGLIGPNGAGKTTLLRTIAGIQRLTRGSVQILGHPLGAGNGDALRHLGFTPDTPVFYESLTVRDFLRFVAMGYGIDAQEADERIAFWLEKVWLAEKAGQKIKSLSRGMRQRVGLARTLLPNPAIVVLDEPAAGLDPSGRVQFRQLMCDLRDQGKAIIISSHILSDMEEYCTHIGIMTEGRMVQFGTVAHVSAHGQAGGRCRYTIVLARAVADLEALLGAMPGVQAVQAERDRASFEFTSGRAEAAGLLAQLVDKKVPVASFVANGLGLEEAYLRIGIKQVD
jgi:ABC-2 type transport system ATP-binding protein